MKALSLLLLISLVGMVTGCQKNCGPSSEPRLNLAINMQSTNQLTGVYALNTVANAPAVTLPQLSSAPNRTYWNLDLPINLNADKTQYVLVTTARRDTVTVNYRRAFTYEDAECGYTVTILPTLNSVSNPTNNSLIIQTTVGKIETVYFKPTTSRTFFGSASDTGIYAFLLWL